MEYVFRPMTRADLPLIRRWLAEPHVREWWGDPEEQYALVSGDLDEPAMDQYVVSTDGTDFGYIQCYDLTAWNSGFGTQPEGTRGIDLFIGDAKSVGRGHGPRLIALVVERLFDEGRPCVITDPNPSNTQSIAAFRKAGFYAIEERDTPWGHFLLMRCDNPDRTMTQ